MLTSTIDHMHRIVLQIYVGLNNMHYNWLSSYLQHKIKESIIETLKNLRKASDPSPNQNRSVPLKINSKEKKIKNIM